MITAKTEPELNEIASQTVKKLFRNDYNEPFEMTPGQVSLFRAIYERQYERTQFECYTQYGKSDTVSMAVLLRATTFGEKWPIVGGTKDKAGIIMGKVIKHVFENDYTLGKFQVGKDESLEMIKRHKAKDHLSFKVDETGAMGEVIVLSADARRKSQDAGDILIGHGAPNLILDDAALIPDMIHGKAMRMLGGHKDNFLLKITNSFGRNHAYKSSEIAAYDRAKPRIPRPNEYTSDAGYHVIKIDYVQGIQEGRISPEYVEEMRGILDPVMFGILYECAYPPSNMVEDGDWMLLFPPELVEEAQKRTVQSVGYKRMGGDVAEGTNFNAFVLRTDNRAWIKEKTVEPDLMKTADTFVRHMREEGIHAHHSYLDAVGVGAGVYARVRQMNVQANGFKAGESPTERTKKQKEEDPIEFANLRAEVYWRMKQWLEQGAALEPNKDWMQLSIIRYRINSDKKVEIMTKKEMRARGYLGMSESTDIPDALSFTFAPSVEPFVMPQQSMPREATYPDVGI